MLFNIYYSLHISFIPLPIIFWMRNILLHAGGLIIHNTIKHCVHAPQQTNYLLYLISVSILQFNIYVIIVWYIFVRQIADIHLTLFAVNGTCTLNLISAALQDSWHDYGDALRVEKKSTECIWMLKTKAVSWHRHRHTQPCT